MVQCKKDFWKPYKRWLIIVVIVKNSGWVFTIDKIDLTTQFRSK